MDKEKIIAALRNRFASLGFGAKAFDGVAAFLQKTVTEDSDLPAALENVEPLLRALQSDVDRVRTEKAAVQAQLDELRKQQKEEGADGKGSAEKAEDGEDAVPTWVRALLDSNKELSERLSAMEGEKLERGRREQLAAIVDQLPEPMRKPYARLSVRELSDEEFAALKEGVTKDVGDIMAMTTARGAVFGRPREGAKVDPAKELTEEQLAAVSRRGAAASTKGQPF